MVLLLKQMGFVNGVSQDLMVRHAFPHENYQRFDLDSMNSAECKAEFRVEKHDLPRLVAALQLPPVFKCEQRSI